MEKEIQMRQFEMINAIGLTLASHIYRVRNVNFARQNSTVTRVCMI